MTRETLTANQWPGPPRILLPLLPADKRPEIYAHAAAEDVPIELLGVLWQDINQRYAAALGAK